MVRDTKKKDTFVGSARASNSEMGEGSNFELDAGTNFEMGHGANFVRETKHEPSFETGGPTWGMGRSVIPVSQFTQVSVSRENI